MSRETRDDPVREAFRVLREDDQRKLPRFSDLLERPIAAPRGRLGARLALGTLAVAVLVVGSLVASRFRSAAGEPDPVALAAWRSPTASLLRTPGHELTTVVPRLSDVELPGLRATNDPPGSPNGRKERRP